MSGFGGAVKLSGESEYRKALSQITQNLKEVSSEMKLVSSSFDKNDKSVEALTAQEETLNKKLTEQTAKLNTLKAQYSAMSSQYQEQTNKHTKLVSEYDKEKNKLEEIGKELGTTSKEYQEQKQKVDDLAREVTKSTSAQDANEKSMSKMRTQINLAQADCNQTAREIDNLGKEAKETGREAESAGEGFTVFKGIVANLASSAIQSAINGIKRLGSEIVNSVSEVGKMGDEIDKSSQKLGISAETYQELSYAMDRSGASIDTISIGMKNITNAIADTQNGVKGASDKFDALGVSVTNADGTFKNAEEVLLDTISALSDMQDETQRGATANDIFGRSYQELAPLLNSGKKGIQALMKEAKDYNMVMSDDAVKASASYEDALTTLRGTMNGLRNNIIGKFMPSITNVVRGFADLVNGTEGAEERVKQSISTLVRQVVRALGKLMPELTGTLFPVLEKIGKAIKDIVTFITKNFSTIAPIVLTVASAFAVWNASMAISKTITAVTTALQGLTAGVGLATKAQAVWNATMSANPIGAVIMAVTALIALVVALGSAESETAKKHKEEMQALQEQEEQINANTDAINDLNEAKQAEIDAGMTEISHYQALWSELKNITDENGKIQKGYEERAEFITSQLSDALGVEIEITDGVVQKNKELEQQIDKVMEKKKAQIILDSQESLYREAINKQTEAVRQLGEMEDALEAKKAEAIQIEQQRAGVRAKMNNAVTAGEQYANRIAMMAIDEREQARQEEVAQIESNMEKQKSLIGQYAYNVGQYESNMALFHAEKYSEMNTVTWNYVKDYQNAENSQKAMLQDQIKTEKNQLALLLQMKEKSGTDLYNSQIKQSQARLNELKASLKAYTQATTEGQSNVSIEWKKGLAEQLSVITGHKITFKNTANGLVQMYIDGVKEGKPKTKAEMAKLATEGINEISKQVTGATKAGEDLINGVNQGIANQNLQSGVFATIANFGQRLLGVFKGSLQEESPSKATRQMGRFLLDGLGLGVADEESKAIAQVSGVGKRVVDALNSEMSQGATLGDITVNSKNTNGFGAYNSMVDAFKEALMGVKIELDSEVAGEFVDRTVTRLVYR